MQQPPQHPHWKLQWTSPVEEIKSTAYLFLHEKSGAPLLYLSNDDDNKVFSITFRTPPTDSTGIAHIKEHAVLAGSERFPTKEPFVDLLKGSLQTFLNAFTADDRTIYPVASRNDKDFTNLMTVYLDAVFFPLSKTVPEILMQEGWHYVLEDGTLSYNGIVYNEMKGVYSSPTSILYRTIQKSMYPDSTYAHDSGGNPDDIPKLTQEMFAAFHDTYYHPSNSMIFLYGDGNIEEHLAFLHDEVLHRFDSPDVTGLPSLQGSQPTAGRLVGGSRQEQLDTFPGDQSAIADVAARRSATYLQNGIACVIPQPPFAAPKDITAEYSVDPGESTEQKTFLSMNYLLPTDLENVERSYGLDLLTYILVNSEGGPLRRALLDAGIGLDVEAGFDSSILQPCFSIIVHNSDPEKKEQFLDVLNTTLKKLVAEGIDRKIIEGAINRTEFVLREFQISGFPKGLAVNMQVLETWTYGGDPLSHLRFEPILANIRAEVKNNFFENLIQKYLLDNPSRGFVMLQPRQGLEAERTAQREARLAEIKAGKSPEQLEAIVRQREVLIERQQAPDRPEDVAKIPRLTLYDVDRKAEDIPFSMYGEYVPLARILMNTPPGAPWGRVFTGTPIVNVEVDTNKIAYVTVLFELRPWTTWTTETTDNPAALSFFASVLGRLDTENYSFTDLSSEIDLHTGGIGTGLSVTSIHGESDHFNLHLTARVKTTLPKLERGLELVHEILAKTKFDDLDRLKEIVQEHRVGLEQSLMSSGHSFARTRAASYFSKINRYRDETGGLEHYKFLVNLEKNFDTEGPKFAQTLKTYAETLFFEKNALTVVTLPKEDFESVKPLLIDFDTKFPGKIWSSGKILSPPQMEQANEAVVIPSRVQYVVQSADFHRAGFKHNGRMLVLSNILRTGYLWNNVRVQGGAYGGGFTADQNGVFSLWSFRDPHLRRTVDVYQGIADYLENLELTDEELANAKIATIGSLDKPLTPSEKGGRVIGMLLSGLTQEDIQRERDEVLATTVEDLRKFAAMFRDGMEQNNICVFGNEAKLTEDGELFKTVIRPIE